MGFFISDHTTPNAEARQKRNDLAFRNQGKSGFTSGGTSIFLFHCLICAHARVFSKAAPRASPMPEKGWTSEFSDTARARMTGDTVVVPLTEQLGNLVLTADEQVFAMKYFTLEQAIKAPGIRHG